MVRRQDQFSGNILLYDYLAAKRAPVFLNRNLTRALRMHQQLSEGNTQTVIAEDQPDLRSSWGPPTLEALDYMMNLEKSKGSFILDIHRIVLDRSKAIDLSPEKAKHTSKARSIFRKQSRLQVSIYDTGGTLLLRVMQDATLQISRTARQDDRSLSLDTERITFTPASPTCHPSQINLSIKFDTKGLLEYLAPGHVSNRRQAKRLSATWPDILEVPPGKTVIKLKNWSGPFGVGLELSMYWAAQTGDSPLAEHNRQRRQSHLPRISGQISRPKTTHRSVKVTFNFDGKTISNDGFFCPHDFKKFDHFEELFLHLEGQHSNITFRADRGGIDENGVENWTCVCKAATHTIQKGEPRPSARAEEPFDNNFVAPDIAFNRKQHLDEGIDDFQRIGRTNNSYTRSRATVEKPTNTTITRSQRRTAEVQARPQQTRKTFPVPAAPPGITFFRSCSKRPLVTGEYISESDDDADDTWIKSRKSAEFEKKTNLSATYKDFLKLYDNHMRSEQLHSDVHAGDALIRFAREQGEWVRQNHAHDVFRQKIDELLEDGIIPEDVHSMCLEHVEQAKLDPLAGNHDISERLVALEIRQTSHDELYDDPPPLRSNDRRTEKGKGKARVTETGHLTPVTADSDGDLEMREAALSEVEQTNTVSERTPSLPYDTCFCGEDAQASYRKSPLIACSSMNCIRRTFHYDCIKERWNITQDFRTLRKSAWVCEDCKPQSTTGN